MTRFLKSGALRWLLPLWGGVIFVIGLAYAYSISNYVSRDLTQLEQETYPLLEKMVLLRAKFRSIQVGFYDGVTQSDRQELEKVERKERESLDLLEEIEPWVKGRERFASLRPLFEEYFDLSRRAGRALIENRKTVDADFSLIEKINQKGGALGALIEELNRETAQDFKKALGKAEDGSRLILRVVLASAVLGMILVAIFSSLIILLNRRLLFSNQNLEVQVRSRTRELESFVYTVSHDLKSPVVSMQGMASIFLEDYGERVDEKGKHYLQRIVSNANFMERLILDLLALSRIGPKEAPSPGDSKEVLREILEMQQEVFGKRNIEVVVSPDLPSFVFDHVHLTQLFQNLITNAAKFLGDRADPRIEIGGREGEGWVEFYVRDNGIGIDPAYHEKIFGVFQRLKEVEVEGTGVGLAIVKKIVDLAGGRIWVESQQGAGATFFVRFPRKAAPRDVETLRS